MLSWFLGLFHRLEEKTNCGVFIEPESRGNGTRTPPRCSHRSLCCTLILPYCAANSEFHTFFLSKLPLPLFLSFCLSPEDGEKRVKSTSKSPLCSTLAVVICLLNNTSNTVLQLQLEHALFTMRLNIVPSIMDSKHRIRLLLVGNPEWFIEDFFFTHFASFYCLWSIIRVFSSFVLGFRRNMGSVPHGCDSRCFFCPRYLCPKSS